MQCIFLHETMIDIYAYKVPVFILLSVNSSFLVWIMMVRYR